MRITNELDISLLLAVWLVDDNYDYAAGAVFEKPYISVTTLMKPLKQIILGMRIPIEDRVEDVSDYISRGLGSTIHDGIERAWKQNYARNLKKLGIPQSAIDKVRINPTDEERKAMPDMIPIFLEQRAYREFGGFVIGGKFDAVAEGHVEDNKSTSAFGWLYGTRDDENQLQGSLYRWIDDALPMPRITEDYMRVNYVFTDWQKSAARTNPNYPQKRVEYKDINLLTLADTELFVRAKLAALKANKDKPESQLPECTDEELWRSDPQYKYYSNPAKANEPGARSSKNFDNLAEANRHMHDQGKGVVKTVPGEVKRCPYCPGYDICEQRKQYFPD
ncbi:hypothetical protein [Aquabacterium sp.]|uniref:hypothetical protein n=1 Tax=Aquabacterium sp. TaxID=1872578 RepID=UPI0025BBD533|nr:hypothetical protein [Aquabacterium sp.]